MLKHLFIVNSGITLLSFKATRTLLGLKDEDLVIAVGRSILPEHPELPVDSTVVTGLPHPWLGVRWNIVKARKRAKAYRLQLAQLMGGQKFVAYLPHSIPSVYRLVHMHPHCVRFGYVEEGTAVYSRQFDSSRVDIQRWCRQPTFADRIVFGRYDKVGWPFDRRASFCFGFFQGAFQGFGLKATMLPRLWKNPLAETYRDAVLLVLPPPVHEEAGLWNYSDFEEMTKAMFLHAKSRYSGRQMCLCAHPCTTSAQQSALFAVASEMGLECESLPSMLSIEEVAASVPCTVLHTGSSAGVYASWLGASVVYCGSLFPKAVREVVVPDWIEFKNGVVIPINEQML